MTYPKVPTPPVAQCARAPSLTVPRGKSCPASSTPGLDVAAAPVWEDMGRMEREEVVEVHYVVASDTGWVYAHCSRACEYSS